MSEPQELNMDAPDECENCGGVMGISEGLGCSRGEGCNPVRIKHCQSLLCGHPRARELRDEHGEPKSRDELEEILEWADEESDEPEEVVHQDPEPAPDEGAQADETRSREKILEGEVQRLRIGQELAGAELRQVHDLIAKAVLPGVRCELRLGAMRQLRKVAGDLGVAIPVPTSKGNSDG